MKGGPQKITVLTAYDFPLARLLDAAGIEAILVGDSMSMVVQGHDTTLPVTLDEMIYHAEMVGRAVQRALVIVDMPFPTTHLGVHKAIECAPVMAHVGLRPQSVHQMGGYKVQRDEQRLRQDAQAAEEAGAFSIVLECVPSPLAASITAALQIPTIGIGAGPDCDGQVLVSHDLLGLTSGYVPRFVKPYADLSTAVQQAVSRFREDVRQGVFPGPENSFS